MLHGLTVSGLPVFDFGGDDPTGRWRGYSWAESLAQEGLRVFIMDQWGVGRSDRQYMDKPCNALKADQAKLIPPLSDPARECSGNYPWPYVYSNTGTDQRDLYNVIQWISGYGARKIALVGYSAAAFSLGRYLRSPDFMYGFGVSSLFLLAPVFPPWGFSDPPPGGPYYAGFPMTIQTRSEFEAPWENEVRNGAQRESGVNEALWSAIMQNDDLGRQWGGGVMRNRTAVRWGWNRREVHKNQYLGSQIPVAIVYGDRDGLAITPRDLDMLQITRQEPEHAGPPFNVKWLYRAIQGEKKLLIRIPNTGHFMPWERKHKVLHDLSAQWIKNGKIMQGGPLPWPPRPGINNGAYEWTSLGGFSPIDIGPGPIVVPLGGLPVRVQAL
ncbi:alpha/beta hydrolase [Micromonospora sp. NPDC051296]|uniref:alpha/beta hydrolase n=1 Tax=Micromonospora sp. NPDC051296 TaxID=3155046 RepID=UPI003449BEB2